MKESFEIMSLEEHIEEARKLFIDAESDSVADTLLKTAMNQYFDYITETSPDLDDLDDIEQLYTDVIRYISLFNSYEQFKTMSLNFIFTEVDEEPNDKDVVGLAGLSGRTHSVKLEDLTISHSIFTITLELCTTASSYGTVERIAPVLFWMKSEY